MTSSYGFICRQCGNLFPEKMKTPPSWILAKSENTKVIALDGVKMSTKFQIDWTNSLKVSRFQKSKMAAGLRLLSLIF
jgi:hypothetical protein